MAVDDRIGAAARGVRELMPHDVPIEVVAIGASAGGVDGLTSVVGQLPADFGAAVLVVLHVSEAGKSILPSILDRAGALPAVSAHEGERIERGRVYVAPPGSHLTVEDGETRLEQTPRENGHRPAVDPLFRTVAHAYGPRCAGVVLSGARDDGTAGLHEIKLHGGVAIVQDPEQALYAGMPRNAMMHTHVDAVLPLAEIGFALVRLAAEDPNAPIDLPVANPVTPTPQGQDGLSSRFACPECGGVLLAFRSGNVERFACEVGHAYSIESLFEEQGHRLEAALWTAIRSLSERAEMLQRMEGQSRKSGGARSAAIFASRARETLERAETIRGALERLSHWHIYEDQRESKGTP